MIGVRYGYTLGVDLVGLATNIGIGCGTQITLKLADACMTALWFGVEGTKQQKVMTKLKEVSRLALVPVEQRPPITEDERELRKLLRTLRVISLPDGTAAARGRVIYK